MTLWRWVGSARSGGRRPGSEDKYAVLSGEQLRRAVVLDPSAILALVDASDGHHAAAVRVAMRIGKAGLAVFITPAIELEAHALRLRKVGRVVARERLPRSGPDVLRPTAATHEDKDWSLCGATSFAVITSRKAAGAFSFGHHFQQAGRFKVWASTSGGEAAQAKGAAA